MTLPKHRKKVYCTVSEQMNRVFNNPVLAVVETFQRVTHKVLPRFKGGFIEGVR